MFLALTADERYWDTGRKLLFLGEWCRTHARREAWRGLPHEVLPYPWDDRKKLFEDYGKLMALYERVLPGLAARLNERHGVDRSTRYWRIVAGPWLYYFIQIAYERNLCLEAAVARGDAEETFVPAGALPPSPDFGTFMNWIGADGYNQGLYAELLRGRDRIRLTEKPGELELPKPRRDGSLKGALRRGLFRTTLALAGRNRIVMIAPYFSWKENLRLHLRLGEVPVLGDFIAPVSPPRPLDEEGRRGLVVGEARDPFERRLFDLIARQLPSLYVENYRDAVAWTAARFPRRAETMVTANCLLSYDYFKLWAADRAERGARIVGHQHGGHYGTGLWNSEEEHEVAVSDRYLSWGWRREEAPHVVPVSASKLPAREAPPSSGGEILWALMSIPRYAYWMYSIPVGPQHADYIRDQEAFAKAVSPEVLRRLVCRPYPMDWGWDEAGRLAEAVPGLRVGAGRARLSNEIKACRIFVGTYNSTTYLESFLFNRPTILFWNPRHWELRPSVARAFEALKGEGILHETPASAAAHLNRVFRAPEAWWRGEGVQRARRDFCARFAWRTGSWLSEWAGELAAAGRLAHA